MSRIVCLLLIAFVGLINAQSFSADFTVSGGSMDNGGFVAGKLYYSYSAGFIKFDYPARNFFELQEYNPNKGYNDYVDQWIYTSGTACAGCDTSSLDFAMPQLFFDGSNTDKYSVGATESIDGTDCVKHTATDSNVEISALWLNGNDVCQFEMTDGFVYALSNYNGAASFTNEFDIPSGCQCGAPIDIVVVLDNSGSVKFGSFKNEKAFAIGFANSFNFGPLNAAMGIVRFSSSATTVVTLNEGVSKDNVDTATESLSCTKDRDEDDADDEDCFSGATSISQGIERGSELLEDSNRSFEGLAKILIVLTDGKHNRDLDGNKCGGNGSDGCAEDLQKAVDEAKARVPGIKIFAVGVGEGALADELLIVADSTPEQVVTYTSFEDLALNFRNLLAKSCVETTSPCGVDCCGFCVCGTCALPDDCADSGLQCTEYLLPTAPTATCCRATPTNPCDTSDLCQDVTCNQVTDLCETTPKDIVCTGDDTQCFDYSCDPAIGLCVSSPKPTAPAACDPTECEPLVDNQPVCDDSDPCTIDTCNADGSCVSTPVDCSGSEMCGTFACVADPDLTAGYFCNFTAFEQDYIENTLCPDGNVCTDAICNNSTGCEYPPLTCAPSGTCIDDICDVSLGGCIATAVVCDSTNTPASEEVDVDGCGFAYACDSRKESVTVGNCTARLIDCLSPNADVAVTTTAAVLGTAAVVGIVVGIVVAVAICAGSAGVYSVYKNTDDDADAAIGNNPLYISSATGGANPLFAGDD